MLAPLPRLHRVVLTLLVLGLGLAGGAAAAQVWELSFPLGGLAVGSGAGLAVGFLLVHDFHHHATPVPRPARALRRH